MNREKIKTLQNLLQYKVVHPTVGDHMDSVERHIKDLVDAILEDDPEALKKSSEPSSGPSAGGAMFTITDAKLTPEQALDMVDTLRKWAIPRIKGTISTLERELPVVDAIVELVKKGLAS